MFKRKINSLISLTIMTCLSIFVITNARTKPVENSSHCLDISSYFYNINEMLSFVSMQNTSTVGNKMDLILPEFEGDDFEYISIKPPGNYVFYNADRYAISIGVSKEDSLEKLERKEKESGNTSVYEINGVNYFLTHGMLEFVKDGFVYN